MYRPKGPLHHARWDPPPSVSQHVGIVATWVSVANTWQTNPVVPNYCNTACGDHWRSPFLVSLPSPRSGCWWAGRPQSFSHLRDSLSPQYLTVMVLSLARTMARNSGISWDQYWLWKWPSELGYRWMQVPRRARLNSVDLLVVGPPDFIFSEGCFYNN